MSITPPGATDEQDPQGEGSTQPTSGWLNTLVRRILQLDVADREDEAMRAAGRVVKRSGFLGSTRSYEFSEADRALLAARVAEAEAEQADPQRLIFTMGSARGDAGPRRATPGRAPTDPVTTTTGA